ncbi:MAG: hypothetical protein DMF88_06585 [Acidobacteria bacterium]|nr:MAG: hypothetical protein DMF88_06585 [Acidobacteriota bacterium]
MAGQQSAFDRRVQGALETAPSRIPVVLGGCGTGRTMLLQRMRERLGRGAAQYVAIERCATTPERFLHAVTASSPFPWQAERQPTTPREAFDLLLVFFDSARAPGGEPCTFLLDEVLELRTFESFPGLRHVLRDLLDGLAASPNRFVLTTRYIARAHRLLRDATSRFEVIHIPPLTAADVIELLAPAFNNYEQMPTDDRDYLGRAMQALTDGRAAYVKTIGDAMGQLGRTVDPRLHRARGYGALKAILDVLAEQEPLTLTEISHRLHRTPGSTKDYLSWLEDVDLVTSRQKRYSFTDPVLRLWVRLHCRPVPPTDEEVGREVQQYAAGSLPHPEAAPALAFAGVDASVDERKSWGIIEID